MKSFHRESNRVRHESGKKYWDIYITDDNYDTYVASCVFNSEPKHSEIEEAWKTKRSCFKLC